MNKKLRTALIWIALLSVALGVAFWLGASALNRAEEVSTGEFVQLIEQNKLVKVRIDGEHVVGERREGGGVVRSTANKTMPIVIGALDKAEGENAVNFDEEETSNSGQWAGVMVNVLFLGLFIFIGVMIFRSFRNSSGGGGGGGGLFGGGGVTKHKAIQVQGNTGKTFADVAGVDEAVEEVKDLKRYLEDPTKFRGRPPCGVLLTGEPGTGKTLLASALAGEAGVPFFAVSGSSFVEMFVGVGAARVRSLFEEARKLGRPCIIFFDEFDSIARKRGGVSFGGGREEKESTLNELLHQMDGVEPSEGILIMAATNQPGILDSAAVRPGRFDRSVVVPRPDVKGREAILKVHAKAVVQRGQKRGITVEFGDDVDFHIIARKTPGMVGADLENLINEAVWFADRLEKDTIDAECFSEAADKVRMGPKRKSVVMNDWEKWAICIHESGHVVVDWFSEHGDPVLKVTAIPRGPALGVTQIVPEEDRYLPTKEWFETQIVGLLGGRAAEEMFLQTGTAGCSNDLERATGLAELMVSRLGMSGLGLRTFGKHSEDFLGNSHSQRDYSEASAVKVDGAVDHLVAEGFKRASELLQRHTEKFKVLVNELYEVETLEQDALIRILGERKIHQPKIGF